jgi:hypothetical protein
MSDVLPALLADKVFHPLSWNLEKTRLNNSTTHDEFNWAVRVIEQFQ